MTGEGLLVTNERRTFTYCKPLIVSLSELPRELNRLDTKNWTPTPHSVEAELVRRLRSFASAVDAIILLDQVDRAGTGVVTAGSQQDALAMLSSRQLFPVKVDLAVQPGAARSSFFGRRISARSLAVFYSQLADLLKSGVPLLRSLELLEDQTSSPAFQQVLQDVREQVADGSRLAESLSRHKKVFGELVLSMVRAGEEGGFVEDLKAEHHACEARLAELERRKTLTSTEREEQARLKKTKLAVKDQMSRLER